MATLSMLRKALIRTFITGGLIEMAIVSEQEFGSTSVPSRKVSDESLGWNETSFVRLPMNGVSSQKSVNFIILSFNIRGPLIRSSTVFNRCAKNSQLSHAQPTEIYSSETDDLP